MAIGIKANIKQMITAYPVPAAFMIGVYLLWLIPSVWNAL
jgi:hypothetical protein